MQAKIIKPVRDLLMFLYFNQNVKAMIAGGAIRDQFCGRACEIKDWDIIVPKLSTEQLMDLLTPEKVMQITGMHFIKGESIGDSSYPDGTVDLVIQDANGVFYNMQFICTELSVVEYVQQMSCNASMIISDATGRVTCLQPFGTFMQGELQCVTGRSKAYIKKVQGYFPKHKHTMVDFIEGPWNETPWGCLNE